MSESQELADRLATIANGVFSQAQLRTAIRELTHSSTTKRVDDVVSALVEQKLLRVVSLSPLESSRSSTTGTAYPSETRYLARDASEYAIALSLRANSYLTHATAVFLHELTETLPRLVFVNREQSPKESTSQLTQEGIDKAFSHRPRVSNYRLSCGDFTIVRIDGKSTARAGVIAMQRNGERLDVTSIARTLIDIVVRPEYSGGPFEVLEAYRSAVRRELVQVNELLALLSTLDYAYPYHQSIGFYLTAAGYQGRALDRLRALGLRFDFYLTHMMRSPILNTDWRVWVPQGLEKLRPLDDEVEV